MNQKIPSISVLILDYSRPREGEILLNSLKKHLKIPAKIIYLVNGASEAAEFEYAVEFFKNGLIDELIIKKNGNGGGFGHCDLTENCKSDYFFFLQVDHELIRDIDSDVINILIETLNDPTPPTFKMLDLAADQGRGQYSDRAHFWKTEEFLKLNVRANAGGGPGKFTHLRWNENYIQEKFKENNWHIAHVEPLFFRDLGKESVREYADGGKTLHETDTKILKILRPLKEKNEWLKLTDEEWEEVFSGNWPTEGKIPAGDLKNSFKYWE